MLLAIMFCITALLIIGIAIILKISNTGLMLRLIINFLIVFNEKLAKRSVLFFFKAILGVEITRRLPKTNKNKPRRDLAVLWGLFCMVEIINSWAQKIIIVIIICTIIEMILPEGKNKKYIKTVIGIYVVFTIISPIISNINTNTLNLSKHFEIEESQTVETSTTINTNKYIEEVYKEKLKSDIRTKIEVMDYAVQNIDLVIETENEETYGTILKLGLQVKEQQQEEVQSKIKINKIVVGDERKEEPSSSISDKEKEKIKQYLAEMYYINTNDINIY